MGSSCHSCDVIVEVLEDVVVESLVLVRGTVEVLLDASLAAELVNVTVEVVVVVAGCCGMRVDVVNDVPDDVTRDVGLMEGVGEVLGIMVKVAAGCGRTYCAGKMLWTLKYLWMSA